jgi:hypothetical protein
MVAELLYLEKQGQSLPIEMLINSSGTTRQDGEIVSIVTRYMSTNLVISAFVCYCHIRQMQQPCLQFQQWYHPSQQLMRMGWAASAWTCGAGFYSYRNSKVEAVASIVAFAVVNPDAAEQMVTVHNTTSRMSAVRLRLLLFLSHALLNHGPAAAAVRMTAVWHADE